VFVPVLVEQQRVLLALGSHALRRAAASTMHRALHGRHTVCRLQEQAIRTWTAHEHADADHAVEMPVGIERCDDHLTGGQACLAGASVANHCPGAAQFEARTCVTVPSRQHQPTSSVAPSAPGFIFAMPGSFGMTPPPLGASPLGVPAGGTFGGSGRSLPPEPWLS